MTRLVNTLIVFRFLRVIPNVKVCSAPHPTPPAAMSLGRDTHPQGPFGSIPSSFLAFLNCWGGEGALDQEPALPFLLASGHRDAHQVLAGQQAEVVTGYGCQAVKGTCDSAPTEGWAFGGNM